MKSLKSWHLLCASLLLCFVCSAESRAAAEVVLCFGDSITAGQDSPQNGYPSHLQPLLDATAQSIAVVNAGQGGEHTYQGVSRIAEALASSKPKYVIIMEGANDVTIGISPESTSFNLENMAQQAKAAGAVPIMSTITPNSNPSYAPENYNPLIKTAATKNGFALVDTYSRVIADWPRISMDSKHPNSEGAKMIAEGFAEQLQSIKRSQEESSGGGGGGCFIATAAFGSALEPQVVLLRKFRDLRLLTNAPGRAFVAWYYQASPPLANFIAQHGLARLTVQAALLPLVATAWLLVEASAAQQAALLLAAASLLTAAWMKRQGKKQN